MIDLLREEVVYVKVKVNERKFSMIIVLTENVNFLSFPNYSISCLLFSRARDPSRAMTIIKKRTFSLIYICYPITQRSCYNFIGIYCFFASWRRILWMIFFLFRTTSFFVFFLCICFYLVSFILSSVFIYSYNYSFIHSFLLNN